MTHEHGNILLVEVQDNESVAITYRIYGNELVVFWNGFMQSNEELPPSNYSILGLAEELSERQWDGIVKYDMEATTYFDYETGQFGIFFATESGLSLVAKYGIKPGNCLILKKK